MTDRSPDDRRNTGHVISLTHWDREWRYPVWKHRQLLVEMMDGLLDLLDREPRYRSFLLDGQTVLVEDYLEIRPENRERLVAHVRGGRIQIGPWYTLPDEFPVDGECLVRNLLRGARSAGRLGGCMRIGLTTFGWGQTAQLPQIYAGFGIETLLIGKGISRTRAPECEFLWEAPDGTALLTSRFGDFGRANFFFHVTLPVLFGRDYLRDWSFDWQAGGLPFHRADEKGRWQDWFRLDNPASYHDGKLPGSVEAACHSVRDTLAPGHLFLGDGSDATVPEPRVLQIIEDANRRSPGCELVHSSLPEYVERLRQSLDFTRLRTIRGELRDGPPEAASANALAVRPQLKRLNRRAQDLLIRTAEPLAAASYVSGTAYPGPFLDIAWQQLLLAQPHDSVNGVTQDKTAADVACRLEQVMELGDVIADQSLQAIVRQIDLGRYAPGDVLLVVFNPLAFRRREIVKAWIDTPREWDAVDIAVVDRENREMEVQPVSRAERVVPVHEANARPWPFAVDRHEVYFDTGEIPPCGYTTLRVVARRTKPREALFWPPPEERRAPSLLVAPHGMENAFLRAELQADGTLDVLDKTSGRRYEGLHFFEDGGDTGDYWVRRRPGHDQRFTTQGGRARIWSECSGPLACTLVTEVAMRLPARADREADRRGLEERDLVLRSSVTLLEDARHLEIRTVFDNNVEDHRLRVLFPTDTRARFSCSEGHFNVDRRPVDPAEHPVNGPWPEMWTHPQQSFVDVSDGVAGVALINDGLCEFEVIHDDRRTLALTLLRAVRNEICTEFRVAGAFPEQNGGQSPGAHEYRYALYFHEGDWAAGRVYPRSRSFNVPLRIAQVGRHDGRLPERHSFFSVEPAGLELSAIKKAEDREAIVMRLFNPGDAAVAGRITCAAPIRGARLVTLNEEAAGDIPIQDGHHVLLEVPAGRIATIEFTWEQARPGDR